MVRYLNAVGLVAGLTFATNILGFIREILIARFFGASAQADAFIAAFTIVSVCFLIFSAGTVQSAFMPIYQQLIIQKKNRSANQLLRRVFLSLSIFLIITVLFVVTEADQIVSFWLPGFDDKQLKLVTSMVMIMAPMIFFIGTGSILQSVSHANQRFMAPALIPLVNNIVIIGCMLTIVPVKGILWVSIAFVIGSVSWWIILLPQTAKYFKSTPYGIIDSKFKNVLLRLWPLLVLLVADQISALIQKTIASQLATGSIAALNFASKIQGLPVGIFSMAIATVFFPALSKAISNDDIIKTQRHFYNGFVGMVYILLPTSVFLFMEANQVVKLFFERGAFDSRATMVTAKALQFYIPGLIAQGLIVYIIRVFFAAGNTIVPMKIGTFSAVMHIFLCWIAVINYGYTGIALGTTLYAWLYLFLLARALKYVLLSHLTNAILKTFFRPCIASILMVVFYYGVDFSVTIIGIAIAVLTGSLIYVASLLVLRDPILQNITFGIKTE